MMNNRTSQNTTRARQSAPSGAQAAPSRPSAPRAAAAAPTARKSGAASQTARPRTGAQPAARPVPGQPPRRPAAAQVRRPGAKKAPAVDQARDRRLTIARVALTVALIVFAFVMLGRNNARDVDFSLIRAAMDPAAAAGGLSAYDENGFRDRFGIGPDGCEDWALYGSDSILTVDELLVAKVPDADARDELIEALQARRDGQLTTFRDYGTNQAYLLERAVLWQRGNYVFYGVSEQVDQWESEFLSVIR